MAKGSSGFDKGGGGVLDRKAETRKIETVYMESRGWGKSYYKDEVLEAVAGGNKGELEFIYATPDSREKHAKSNKTQYVTFNLKSGAENGEIFGVNWDNVKSVSGQTYNIKEEIKRRGFKWDSRTKSWVKK